MENSGYRARKQWESKLARDCKSATTKPAFNQQTGWLWIRILFFFQKFSRSFYLIFNCRGLHTGKCTSFELAWDFLKFTRVGLRVGGTTIHFYIPKCIIITVHSRGEGWKFCERNQFKYLRWIFKVHCEIGRFRNAIVQIEMDCFNFPFFLLYSTFFAEC